MTSFKNPLPADQQLGRQQQFPGVAVNQQLQLKFTPTSIKTLAKPIVISKIRKLSSRFSNQNLLETMGIPPKYFVESLTFVH
jgi:hypothetical protein